MNNASILLIIADIIKLLQTQGFISATEAFDPTKFNNIGNDAILAAGVETILKAHGVATPTNVDRVIQLLPILAGFIK